MIPVFQFTHFSPTHSKLGLQVPDSQYTDRAKLTKSREIIFKKNAF